MSEENKIGEKIRQVRENKGMSVEELAEASQNSVELIENLENGSHIPSLTPLFKIAKTDGLQPGEAVISELREDGRADRKGEETLFGNLFGVVQCLLHRGIFGPESLYIRRKGGFILDLFRVKRGELFVLIDCTKQCMDMMILFL